MTSTNCFTLKPLLFLLLLSFTSLWAQAQNDDGIESPIVHITDTKAYLPDCVNSDLLVQEECSIETLSDYIYERLEYPDRAQLQDKEGTVVVSFNIDKDGLMRDIQIIQSISNPLDTEVLRVMQLAQRDFTWIPAMDDRKAVVTSIQLPITFKFR